MSMKTALTEEKGASARAGGFFNLLNQQIKILLFLDWKRAIFRCGKKIKVLRGDVVLYVAQAGLQIDSATAEKGCFQLKTTLLLQRGSPHPSRRKSRQGNDKRFCSQAF